MTNITRNTLTLLFAFILFGCGQSGPLYVAGNPSAVQPQVEEESTEEDEQDESGETDQQ